jgi:high-affinity iron transporter
VLPALVIFFRESLEASLIVGILLAYLRRVGRGDAARLVWLGVAAALAADLVVGLATFGVIRSYDGSPAQLGLEGGTYLLATAILTYMSFWMERQAGEMRGELERRARAALSRGSLGAMALLSGVTVGREGLETVFFTLAVALRTPLPRLALGAALGLAAGLSVTWGMNRMGRRVPLHLFFQVLGVLLLLFAAGLLADGVQDLQALGWLPFLRQVLWRSGSLLREQSLPGDLLHSFFGYAESPTALQVGAYVTFLAAAVTAYVRLGRRPRIPRGGAPARLR